MYANRYVRCKVGVVLVAVGLLVGACTGDDGSGSTAGGSTTPTIEPPPDPSAVVASLCAATPGLAEIQPTVASAALTELSGLVASRRQDGVWWALNDSGNEPRLYAVGADGEDLGSVLVDGVDNVDWEDLAIGPGPDGDLLYIADIGNNVGDRTTVPIIVVPEPDLTGGPPASVPVQRAIELNWADGARDAETLIVDPVESELVIVTKRYDGASEIVVANSSLTGPPEMEVVGTVDLADLVDVPPEGAPGFEVLGVGAATAGDITERGDVVLVRTYGTVLAWPRQPDQTVAEALIENEPCEPPVESEQQGEAIAVDPGGGGYRTISEGTNPPVNRFEAGPVAG